LIISPGSKLQVLNYARLPNALTSYADNARERLAGADRRAGMNDVCM